MAMKPAEVRAARAFLRKRGVKDISPRKFAASSLETGMNYRALLDFLAGVKNGHDDTAVRHSPGSDLKEANG